MSLRVLWFVLAGFILGFATSTLWEWLYYRGKRRKQFVEAARPIFPPIPPTPAHIEPEASVTQPQETWPLPYRSPGVYLESEQPPIHSPLPPQAPPPEALGGTEEATPLAFTPPIAPAPVPGIVDTSSTPPSTSATPQLNPATLLALRSTVAKTPIAQPVSVKVANLATPTLHATEPVTIPAAFLAAAPGTQPFVQPRKLAEDPITERVEANAVLVEPTPSPTVALEQAIEPASVTQNVTEPSEFVPPAKTLPTKAAAFTDHPDDLALIKGVGEAYKRRLYTAGIYTWRQVAESDIETLRRITRVKPNANIGGWRQQAQDLAEKYQRWDTTFQGPLDDFTRIDGIGAITADILYKANLCTYEQLASTSPDELAKIVPAPTVGDEIDFAGWINAAARFANSKRRNQELFA